MPKRAARACNFSSVTAAGTAALVVDVTPNFFARSSKRSCAVISESLTTFFEGSSADASPSAAATGSDGASMTGIGTEMFRLSEIGLAAGTDELDVSGEDDLMEPVGDWISSCVESSSDWSSSS